MSLSRGFRQAAPIQKRVEPTCFASFARWMTFSISSNRSFSRPVSYRALCGQYLQSSGQAPVLIDKSVLTCTSFGLKCCLCTTWALNSKSLNGIANKASTSALVQSFRIVVVCAEGALASVIDCPLLIIIAGLVYAPISTCQL